MTITIIIIDAYSLVTWRVIVYMVISNHFVPYKKKIHIYDFCLLKSLQNIEEHGSIAAIYL